MRDNKQREAAGIAELYIQEEPRKVILLPDYVPVESLLGATDSIIIDSQVWARGNRGTSSDKSSYSVLGERELCICGGFIRHSSTKTNISPTCSMCDSPIPTGKMGRRLDLSDRYEGSITNNDPSLDGTTLTLNDAPNKRISRVNGVSGEWEKNNLGLSLKKVRFSGKAGAKRLRFVDSSGTFFPAPQSAGLVLAYHPKGVLGILPIHPSIANEMTEAGVEVTGNIDDLLGIIDKEKEENKTSLETAETTPSVKRKEDLHQESRRPQDSKNTEEFLGFWRLEGGLMHFRVYEDEETSELVVDAWNRKTLEPFKVSDASFSKIDARSVQDVTLRFTTTWTATGWVVKYSFNIEENGRLSGTRVMPVSLTNNQFKSGSCQARTLATNYGRSHEEYHWRL